VSAVATSNLAALELYYRAIASRDSIGIYGPDTLTAALAAQAVAIDPKFAQAWALLTEARSWLLHQGITFDTLPAYHAYERTGALAPGSLEARLAAGYYLYFVRADYPGALAQFEAGATLSPRSGSILIAIGLVQRRMGRWDDALATFQRAKSANPHDASVAAVLAETYGLMRRYQEGDSEFARALALAPLGSVSFQRFQLLLDGVGDSARARDVASAAVQQMSPETAARLRAALAQVRRDYPTAIAQLESVPRSAFLEAVPPRDLSLALLWRCAGDRGRSQALADSTIVEADRALARWPSADARSSAGIRAMIEGYRAVALALAGDSAGAVRQAAQAQRDLPPTQDHLTGIVLQRWIAVAYVYAGRPAEAIATVHRLMSEPATLGLGELRLDPIWDPIRHNPEFQALTAQ
ncbi:MAG TPA: tetratricopeptide repeat protein, partial [Gemmatimonadales bacterium]|nr:tetratricopeptide repeat protein [Gemmatimonadales bacterium]